MKKVARPPGPKRPGAVVVAGWVAILGIPFIVIRLGWLLTQGQLEPIQPGQVLDAAAWASSQGLDTLQLITAGLIVALCLIAAIAFLRLKRWAWVTLMLAVALGLAANLLRYFFLIPEYGLMLIYAVMALILNQGDVQRAFRVGRPIDESVE